jgi:hypothetical protein
MTEKDFTMPRRSLIASINASARCGKAALKLIADCICRFRCFFASGLNIFTDTRYCVASTKNGRGGNE